MPQNLHAFTIESRYPGFARQFGIPEAVVLSKSFLDGSFLPACSTQRTAAQNVKNWTPSGVSKTSHPGERFTPVPFWVSHPSEPIRKNADDTGLSEKKRFSWNRLFSMDGFVIVRVMVSSSFFYGTGTTGAHDSTDSFPADFTA